MKDCLHTSQRGREGETGSWCIDCGVKVYERETRECQGCKHYFSNVGYTGCRKHLMAVTPGMKVNYKIIQGTCWEPQPPEA